MNKIIIALLAVSVGLSGIAFGQQAPGWFPDNGTRVLYYRASSGGNGTTTLQFEQLVGTKAGWIYDGCFAYVVKDAAGTGSAPQTEFREITDFNSTTGVITVSPAFTALGTGDIVIISPRPDLQALIGTQGAPADPTGAFHAAGINVIEMIAQVQDSMRLVHPFIADMDGDLDDIDTTADNAVAGILVIQTAITDGTGEIDTTLENTRAAVALVLAATADGTGEIDTTLENVRAAVATTLAAIADGTGEIDTTLENTMTAVARIETYTDTEVGALRDSLEDANDILQSLNASSPFYSSRGGTNFLEVTTGAQSVDSTWSSVATHEVFTITGPVEIWIACYDSVDYTGGDSLGLLFAGLTPYNKFAKGDVDAGEIVSLHTPPAGGLTIVTHVSDPANSLVTVGPSNTVVPVIHAVSTGGLDFGYEIYTASAPAGILIFKCWWRALNGSATVVAGAGGTL